MRAFRMLGVVGLAAMCLLWCGCRKATPLQDAEVGSTESGVTTGDTESRTPDASAEQTASTPNPAEAEMPAVGAEAASATEAGGTSIQIPDAFAWRDWPKPEVALVITGQQHGYIEPCGCTGLENQKGGLARRFTLVEQLREKEWQLLPIDSGNQVRRFGPQPAIKFQTAVDGLKQMGYRAVGFGPDDLRLGVENLLSVASDTSSELQFVSANITLFDPSLLPHWRIVEAGSRKVGITAALSPDRIGQSSSDEITVDPPQAGLQGALEEFAKEQCDYRVLMWYGDLASGEAIVKEVPGWDLLVLGDDPGEPTYRPEPIEGSETRVVRVGHKGMHACILGLYPEDAEIKERYARVPLTHEFKDAPEMMALLATYQQHLEAVGLEGLGLRPIPHPSGRQFVGSESCGECHTTAYEIWEKTPHFHATESLVHPPNDRSEVPRHFDPECLSCHVTGWNAQNYYPYASGYLSLEASPLLTGNGCENCHGPGSEHVAAENGDVEADEAKLTALRKSMQMPLATAREQCMECHDIDNSPDFHHEGAFEEYWSKVEHRGKD